MLRAFDQQHAELLAAHAQLTEAMDASRNRTRLAPLLARLLDEPGPLR